MKSLPSVSRSAWVKSTATGTSSRGAPPYSRRAASSDGALATFCRKRSTSARSCLRARTKSRNWSRKPSSSWTFWTSRSAFVSASVISLPNPVGPTSR